MKANHWAITPPVPFYLSRPNSAYVHKFGRRNKKLKREVDRTGWRDFLTTREKFIARREERIATAISEVHNIKFKPLSDDWATLSSVDEFIESMRAGAIFPSDGCGFWCKSNNGVTMESNVSAFDTKPEWANMVSWYNKQPRMTFLLKEKAR